MPASLINSGVAGSTDFNNVSLGPLNMVGANFLAIVIAYDIAATGISGPGDGVNSYTLTQLFTSPVGAKIGIYFSENPVVNSAMTFTFNSSVGFPAIAAYGFAGMQINSFDKSNASGTTGATSLSTGIIFPGESEEVLITGMVWENTFSSPTINGGFSSPPINVAYNSGFAYGLGASYLIKNDMNSANPAFSWTTSAPGAAIIASFRAGAKKILMGQSIQ